MLEVKQREMTQVEPRQIEVATSTCKWLAENQLTCMLDGIACDGECESYEPKREVVDFGTLRA